MNSQHSSKSNNWYTPLEVIDLSRQVLGKIDLDPASDEFGNSRVQAASYYSHGGLSLPWYGSVFVNPPGGKVASQSRSKLFWKNLMKHREAALIDHAIFIAFSIEALQTSQISEYPSMCKFPICIPNRRLRFDAPEGETPKSPTHANAVIYVTGKRDKTQEFAKVFSKLGDILNVCKWH